MNSSLAFSRDVSLGRLWFRLQFFARDDVFSVPSEKASWQALERPIRNIFVISKIVIGFLIQSLFTNPLIIFKRIACQELIFRSKRSLRSPVFECNTGNSLKSTENIIKDFENIPILI